MNREILELFKHMENLKGIKRDELIPVICDAIKECSKKGFNAGQDVRVTISPSSGEIAMFAKKRVVQAASDPLTEIDVKHAQLYVDNPQIGDEVEISIDPSTLGRIASQAVRQRIHEFVRLSDSRRLVATYSGQVGQLITGEVSGFDKRAITVTLADGTEAILPLKEQARGERLEKGSRYLFLLKRVGSADENQEIKDQRPPRVILSRADENFVFQLIAREVDEVRNGTISIINIVRRAGSRTKVLVSTEDPNVDPVGACVGKHATRVKALNTVIPRGEKIDFIKWNDDVELLLQDCFKVRSLHNVQVDEEKRVIRFEVAQSDAGKVVGTRGENLNLTQDLLNYHLKLNVVADQNAKTMDEQILEAAKVFEAAGIPHDLAIRLVAVGITTFAMLRDPAAEAFLRQALMKDGTPVFSEEEVAGVIAVAGTQE